MKLTNRSQLEVFLKVFGILALVSAGAPAWAEDAPVAALKAAVEGAYVLESWKHPNGEVLRPPAVDARAILLNGRIMFIAHDRPQDSNSKTTIAGFGTYELAPGKYSYGYQSYTVVSLTPDGTFVSETLPWEGMRTFAASVKGKELHLRATDGPQELRITPEGLSYSDGEQTRVYRRVTAK